MKAKKPSHKLLGTTEICQRLGIHRRQLSDWCSLGLEPDGWQKGKNGKQTQMWDLQRVRDWAANNVKVRSVFEAIETDGKKAKREAFQIDPAIAGGGTFDDALSRLGQAERIEFARYAEALKADDAQAIQARRKAWLESLEQMRRIERDAPEVKRLKGELVSKADAEAEMVRMCLTVKQAMLGLKGSLPPMLVGREEAEMSVMIDKAIRDACVSLTTVDKARDEKIDAAVKEIMK